MSKRAEKSAELIANGIMINVQGRTGRVIYNTKEKSFDHHDLMSAARKGYEQAEKDIWAAIEKYLSKLDTGDFATVGWILKHLDEYKKAILEEE